MSELILAADLGGTNLRMGVVDNGGRLNHLTKSPVPKGVSPDGLMSLVDSMATAIRAQMSGEFRGVAFTAPSPIPADFDGVLTKLPNLGSVTGVNFTAALKKLFGLPVIAENDATAAAIGEHWLGASRDVQTSVTVTLGTGIGGGVIINGDIIRGPDGIGGEIGHITVERNGRQCKCGNIGCIEEYASATAIQRMAAERGLDVATAADVYDAWKKGDESARSVFEEMGRYLGQMLAGLANALNPEMFVICGGASNAWDAFADTTAAEIKKRAYPAAAARAKLRRGELGDNAGILGAARSAFLRLQ